MNNIVMQPMKWSSLEDIDSVAPLSESDSPMLSEVREVLKKHGALDRFGLCLLHSHFPMGESEYLFEETNEDERTQRITVSQSSEPDENTIQTMWRFSEDETVNITVCVQRCKYFLGHSLKHVKEGR